MQKITITILVLALSTGISFSQDIILKKTGDEIAVKVFEVGLTEVKYKNFNDQEGSIFILSKSDVFMIRYENGAKDIFTDEETEGSPSYSDEDLFIKGEREAAIHYTGKRSGAVWIAATTILLTPLVGIIPAVACGSTKPSYQNLNFPDEALAEDASYNNAYTKKAHRIKKKKVWKSFGISSGAWLLLIILL